MTYISIQSVKCVFLKVLEILNLQVSVKGQTPGDHCYNQLFQFVYLYNERRDRAGIYTWSLQAYPGIS